MNNKLKTTDFSTLTPEEKNEIISIKEGIVLNYDYISKYGSDLDKKYNILAKTLLDEIRLKDSPEAEEALTKLLTSLEPIDVNNLMERKVSFFGRLFKRGTTEIKNITEKYQSVQQVIDSAKKQLEATSFQLKKDIEVCDINFKTTCEYITELDKRIKAGRLCCEEEKASISTDLLNTSQEDTYAMTLIDERQRELNRMERKIDSFVLKKEAKVINAKELLIMKENCAALIEQIDNTIQDAIPLWEANLLMAIQLVRQQNALKISESARETTNNLFKANMEMLKVNSVGIAKALESGFIDYSVFKDVQKSLVETVTEIKKVHEEGMKQRQAQISEIEEKKQEINKIELGIIE